MTGHDVTDRRVVMLCSRRPIVAEFVLLAEAVADLTDLQTVLVVPDGLENMLPARLPQRCSVIFTGPRSWKASFGANSIYKAFGAWRKLSRLLRRASLANFAEFLDTSEALSRGRWIARNILHVDKGCVAVLAADDRDIRVDQGILKAARDRHIFTMAVSFGKSDPDADALRRDHPLYDVDTAPLKRMKQYIARKYPEGVRRSATGRRLLFFSPGQYWALRLQGALFGTPWSYGGGNADRVAVSEEGSAQLLRRMGVSPDKIIVAGQCSHDVLWGTLQRRSEIRKALNEEYLLKPNQPLVILAMPVLGEHGMRSSSEQSHEATYLLDTLGRVNKPNVLVSLHPRQDPHHYSSLVEQYGLRLATGPLSGILAAADLFVAYSTTIAWAQLLAVPSVALEYYGLGYTLFEGQPGVLAVREQDRLASACRTLLADGPERGELVDQLKSFEGRQTFDGDVRKRLILEMQRRSRRNI